VSGAFVVVVDLQVNRARRCFESLGDFPDACGFGQLDDSGYIFLVPESICIRSAKAKSFRQAPAWLFVNACSCCAINALSFLGILVDLTMVNAFSDQTW
jgi:hypothetical protein